MLCGRVLFALQAKSEEGVAIHAEFQRCVNDRVDEIQAGFDSYINGAKLVGNVDVNNVV